MILLWSPTGLQREHALDNGVLKDIEYEYLFPSDSQKLNFIIHIVTAN